jgi:uncharacterized membrane protein YozB (DUF420 family)
MVELLHMPGFLGTAANFAADATLVIMLAIALAFSVGFGLARMGKYEAHRWVQTSAAVLSGGLVVWLMILPYRDFILPGVPGRLGEAFYGVTTLHAVVGAVALPFGMFVVLRGNRLVPGFLRFRNYKLFMRTAYVLYMLTIFLGVLVYIFWFVTNPNPPQYG